MGSRALGETVVVLFVANAHGAVAVIIPVECYASVAEHYSKVGLFGSAL